MYQVKIFVVNYSPNFYNSFILIAGIDMAENVNGKAFQLFSFLHPWKLSVNKKVLKKEKERKVFMKFSGTGKFHMFKLLFSV